MADDYAKHREENRKDYEELVRLKTYATAEALYGPRYTMDILTGKEPLYDKHIAQKLSWIRDAETPADIDRALKRRTDAEVLQSLINTWYTSPPDITGYEATKYYFRKVYGEEKYHQVFDDESVDADQVRAFQLRVLGDYEED